MNWLLFLLHVAHGLWLRVVAPLIWVLNKARNFYFYRLRLLWSRRARVHRKRFTRRYMTGPTAKRADDMVIRYRHSRGRGGDQK